MRKLRTDRRNNPTETDNSEPKAAIEPRCLTRDQAATYCAITPGGFSAWVRQDIVPGPIPGTKRWDRRAIDAALDKACGLRDAEA